MGVLGRLGSFFFSFLFFTVHDGDTFSFNSFMDGTGASAAQCSAVRGVYRIARVKRKKESKAKQQLARK